jgi:hypothetical protein
MGRRLTSAESHAGAARVSHRRRFGVNVRVEIDDQSGEAVKANFTPR